MKRFISVLLIVTMIISLLALAGCGANGKTEEDKLTVCLAVASAFGDKSLNDSSKEGVERLAEDYDIKVNTVECNEKNYKQSMMDAAKASDVVVLVGWQFYEVAEVAEENPGVRFIWVDNPADGIEELSNVLCILYAQNEGSFLAGYIAAKMSETGVVGAVGGEDVTATKDFLVGYEQGAKYADPEIEVAIDYSEDYEDPEKGKECALKLREQGADVIFAVAGAAGEGVFSAAKEEGFYAVGVDQDQKLVSPEYDEQIICSVKKEAGNSIYDMLKAFIENGSWEGARIWTADMSSGYVSVTYGDETSARQVSEELKAEAEEIAAGIVSGEIKVETARQ